jgi:hypothetical protein
MIFCIVTTSLIKNYYDERKQQYCKAISTLIDRCKYIPMKIIIVENNNNTSSFLDDFGVDVVYTDNNLKYDTPNIGIKEMNDIFHCIEKYDMKDEDYVIKMSGRYILADHSPFINEIMKLNETKYEAILKYGWWRPSPRTKHEDCITGLICMKAKYVKQIEIPNDDTTCIEARWAKVTLPIPDDQMCILNQLGINICPSSHNTTNYMEV